MSPNNMQQVVGTFKILDPQVKKAILTNKRPPTQASLTNTAGF